jgi:DNA-binding SARP family transcriptional activator
LGETRIQLCGRLVVRIEGHRVEGRLPGRQGRLLFAYLCLNRARPASRWELLDAVWPDEQPDAADSALSALLSKLRRVVPLAGRGAVELVLPAGAWIDVEAAAEALHRAESALGRGEWTAAYGPARVVQHIAGRGLLPDEEGGWVAARRQRLEETYLRGLELVATASLGIGGNELATAERAARTLVERAPLREPGARLLMEVLERRGDRAGALAVYDELRIRLRDGGDDNVFVITREALLAAKAQSRPATRAAASPRPRAARSPARASASAAARRRRSARGSAGSR